MDKNFISINYSNNIKITKMPKEDFFESISGLNEKQFRLVAYSSPWQFYQNNCSYKSQYLVAVV